MPKPGAVANAATNAVPTDDAEHLTAVLRALISRPGELLVRRWNWKSAVTSSFMRAIIFLVATLKGGSRAALAGMFTELVFRLVTSGFYGALIQSFRRVNPPWVALLAIGLVLPVLSHAAQLLVHWFRGTMNLRAGMIASVCFTALSTAFNWFAMRKGALLVGEGHTSLWTDLARMPRIVLDFLRAAAGLGTNRA